MKRYITGIMVALMLLLPATTASAHSYNENCRHNYYWISTGGGWSYKLVNHFTFGQHHHDYQHRYAYYDPQTSSVKFTYHWETEIC